MTSRPQPPRAAIMLLRSLLHDAERDEVEADIRGEYAMRCDRDGVESANAWIWRQASASAPASLKRSWWRGWTGFESQAHMHRPGGVMLEQWIQDARFAVRRLMKRPLFATLAIVTLALGVGGTAAVYSLVRTLLLEPLPYGNSSTLAAFWNPFDWSQAEHLFLQDNMPAGFSDIAAYTQMDLTFTAPDGGAPQSTSMIVSSANLFGVLDVQPLFGQVFGPGDDAQGAEPKVVLSYGLWRTLGEDRSLIGRPLEIGGEPHTIIGVMPPGFWFPDPEARVWVNAPFDPENRSGNYAMIGRLADGYTFGNMAAPLAQMGTRLRERFDYPPDWDKTRNPVLTPIADSVAGTVKPMLLATLAAMALILLIACSNVAALMLGQVDSRSTELAVRSALGANRRQLMQQLVMETVILGVAAGLLGSLLAAGSFSVLKHSLALGALLDNAQLDWSVFTGAMGISLLAALVVAAVPAISLWRGDLRDSLTHSRTSGISGRGGRTENALVIFEVALAVLLVAGAALLIRTVDNLRSIDPGVTVEQVAVLDIITEYTTARPERARMLSDIIPGLQALPGVENAALTQQLPLRHGGNNWGFHVEGIERGNQSTTAFRIVTPGYLSTLGIDIRQGRDFTPADAVSEEPLVIINEATRDAFFGPVDPIGRMVASGTGGLARVIGVAGNAAEAGLTAGPTPARYMLLSHVPSTALQQTVVIRTREGVDPASVFDAARSTIERVAPIVAVSNTTTMQDVFDRAVGPALQLKSLLVILGGLALVLGAVGVYGVVSHFVGKRRREWSIRMALGLRPWQLIGRIVARGGMLVAAGTVIGIIASLAVMRVLSTFLYDVTPADRPSLMIAMAILLAAGMLAALIPAWRASRADPATVLREQ
ncbi:MAG TPA: ADOP family duplicated permease [Longimicrobiales bacterium]|nr:ADOP family duplicated permease [Longimicrobiales bacterium]